MASESCRSSVAVVILAAGRGTRMKSQRAKVLHEVAGRPMILYVVDSAVNVAGRSVVVVVGTQAEEVKRLVSSHASVEFAFQSSQMGTGHAAMCSLPALPEDIEHVVLLCGDVPLIKPETLDLLIRTHITRRADVTVVGAEMADPTGYGRLRQNQEGTVEAIVEEADASPEEKKISTVNTGIYCVNRRFLESSLSGLDTDNAQGEMYLTDIVGIAARAGRRVELILCSDNTEMLGINTMEDLARVEALLSGDEKP